MTPKNSEGEPIPVTNEAEFGYGISVGTSPPELLAAQIHAGKGVEETAKEDGLHGWNDEGALTPVRRYAEMLSGTGLSSSDGSEWYFPERLTIDSGAVAEGNANPAQEVLGLHAIHGHELPQSLRILAISSELDKSNGATPLQDAEILAAQSGIPKGNLALINRESSYANNDAAGADPEGNPEGNIFFQKAQGGSWKASDREMDAHTGAVSPTTTRTGSSAGVSPAATIAPIRASVSER